MERQRLVVATLGFDERFALRALTEHRPDRLYALALYTDESSWSRVSRAFSQLRLFAEQLGVGAELVRIDYRGERISVLAGRLKALLESYAESSGELVLALTGGPRLLVVAALVAALSLPERLVERMVLRLEGEGFDVVAEEQLANLRYVELDPTARRVLGLLVEVRREGRWVGPTEVSERLGIPKSTAYKKLQELVARGLAEYDQRSRRYTATERAYVNA
ncbi:CRISPR-associated protein, Csa3 family [Pyrodictium delaneyi]|uniref:CRISPR-associated protein, Csa3 family n=1 Tax=Pyrodictium delaneyi TaxID=1273541 RepID=A0A0P0N1J9_9CREN|nr:helix-turn-helix domain-containing protein [Pyrodictium delaneyi]ALL00359.1 CRISPR-associated protein, Csa3 family [Pyrodictium delaneyi]